MRARRQRDPKPKPEPAPCPHCGMAPVHHATGLCITDYQFRRRNGRLRTEAEMARHGQRLIERRSA